MEYRRVGDSDLVVSEVSLGSWLTYSGGEEREKTEACTKAAFEAGINFFNTSAVSVFRPQYQGLAAPSR